MYQKTMLIILDGWAHGDQTASNAIHLAKTPFIDSLYQKYPNAELLTSGESVGLPEGQMGNSEVGHLNLGAGRVVYQELLRINNAIADGSLENNEVVKKAFTYARENEKTVHFIGLVSDGGVHSHINHLKALCDIAAKNGLTRVFIHGFTDGRDTDPNSGEGFIRDLQDHLSNSTGKLASITGRYYAMDRDRRWQRTHEAWDVLVNGNGIITEDLLESLRDSYRAGITDEFIKPIVMAGEGGKPLATLQEGDVLFCVNFRTDRPRQLIEVLTQKDMPEEGMHRLSLYTVTMASYDDTFRDIEVVMEKRNLEQTFGEIIASKGLTQLRIAETEKYPHVSYFFSGGREDEFPGEARVMIPSPKVATYDLKPEMSAPEVTGAVVNSIHAQPPDFICLNFANADMVGHTGDLGAAMKAVETVDRCARIVVEAALEKNYMILLTADHGNADYMVNEDGSPNTAHTKNPVPVFLIGKDLDKSIHIKNGILADIAPTLLKLMEIEAPAIMTGKSLIGS